MLPRRSEGMRKLAMEKREKCWASEFVEEVFSLSCRRLNMKRTMRNGGWMGVCVSVECYGRTKRRIYKIIHKRQHQLLCLISHAHQESLRKFSNKQEHHDTCSLLSVANMPTVTTSRAL